MRKLAACLSMGLWVGCSRCTGSHHLTCAPHRFSAADNLTPLPCRYSDTSSAAG